MFKDQVQEDNSIIEIVNDNESEDINFSKLNKQRGIQMKSNFRPQTAKIGNSEP